MTRTLAALLIAHSLIGCSAAPAPVEVQEPTVEEVVVECVKADILRTLKNPADASFGDLHVQPIVLVKGTPLHPVVGRVDATNSFGAKLRAYFKFYVWVIPGTGPVIVTRRWE